MSRPKRKLGLIILILIRLLACVRGEDQNKFVCVGNGSYTNNSTFEANLKSLLFSLSSLSSLTSNNGFYNVSVGQGRDTVNAIALCRVDRTLDQCRSCIRGAADALPGKCPNWKQVIVWYEYCMLRYSDQIIYATLATDPADNWKNTEDVSNPDQFGAVRTRLFDVVREQAANGGAELKVGAGRGNVSASQTLYGTMQCTPDLSRDECDSCLQKAIRDYLNCCNRAPGARTLTPSCNLRYELFPFYNETRLRELQVTPSLLPSPPVPSPPVLNNNSTSPGKQDENNSKTIIIVIAGVILSLLVACAIFFIRKRMKRKKEYIPQAHEEILTSERLQYDFGRIRDATNDFADPNKLGTGGFGSVYHGNLAAGEEIAVKRLSKDSGQGIVEFMNEVMLLAKLQHRNLVRLLGFSTEGTERLLIYEFVQNASLDKFIFDPIKRAQFEWDKRYKIIGGIAKGLLYLHEDSRLKIIHRDLKASNILLDGDMNPKIADFGMARLFGQDETQANTSKIVGTYGYMSPEYAIHGKFSIKSDVFSFGVLVLEIVTGQRNLYFQSGEIVQDLLTHAWKNWQEGTPENVIDPTLLRNGSSYLKDILRCIHIGLLCVQEKAASRPTMASIVLMLSSSTITLPRPSEPAFYMSSRFGPEGSLLQESNPESTSSRNEMSVSEFYPR